MSSTAALQILLSAKDEASPVLERTSGKLKGLGTAAKTAFGIIGGAVGASAVGILADATRAAAEDEVSMIALKTAVENTGVAWEANSAAIEERIKKGQSLAFSDSDVRNSIAQLTTATGDANKALDMQNLVMDIARGRNISLGDATNIAQKAALGQFGALKKIGIVLAEGSTATEALGELQKRYANQADNYGSTNQAAIFRVKDAIDEWKEGIGAATGPAMGFIALLPGLSSGMTMAGGAVGGLSKLINLSFIPSLVAMAIPFAPIILVVGAIGLAIGLLALAWSNNWGDIQGKTQAVIGFLDGLFDGFKLLVLNVFKGIVLGVTGFINGVIEIVNGFIEKYNVLAGVLSLPKIGKIEVLTPNLDAIDAQIDAVASKRRVATIVAQMVGGFAGGSGGGAGPAIYHHGTPFVPRTGLAMLERGEAVIPARANPWGGGSASSGGGASITVNLNGPVYGMADFNSQVTRAVREAVQRGGFRGVLAGA